ncbi:MAG: RNA polymerase sigma factor [Balneolaceae bacterium]|nr:RNA polymerase sigma factor [Balneolaceae bacterium]
MDRHSDNALMLQVKSGDLDKLGLLFERYNRRLFGFFYRLTSRRDLSEDLVQGVFERIITYRHTYSDEGAFSCDLDLPDRAQPAHRPLPEEQRPGRRGGRFRGPGYPERGPPPARRASRLHRDGSRPRPAAPTAEGGAWTSRSPERETLVLSRYQGFRYREIAEIMDCSESAVKVRIFRALGELREIVAQLNNEEHP